MTNSSWEALADEPIDDIDLQILELVRAHQESVDPVPEGLAQRIEFAMTVAALEAEVARIVAEPELAGVRTDVYHRASTITFESDGFTATLTVEPADGRGLSVRGWVSEPGAEVELRERTRAHTQATDTHGRFAFTGIESGMIQAVFRRPGLSTVITPAFEI